MQLRKPWVPPGLAELAEQEGLNENQVKQLTFAYTTIRGYRPQTAQEWQPIYQAAKPYLTGDFGEPNETTDD